MPPPLPPRTCARLQHDCSTACVLSARSSVRLPLLFSSAWEGTHFAANHNTPSPRHARHTRRARHPTHPPTHPSLGPWKVDEGETIKIGSGEFGTVSSGKLKPSSGASEVRGWFDLIALHEWHAPPVVLVHFTNKIEKEREIGNRT